MNSPGAGVLLAALGAGQGSLTVEAGPDPGYDPRTSPGPKLLLSPAGAASALSISRSKVYRLLREGRLQSVMLGGNRRITVASLERLVDDLLDVTETRDNDVTPA